MRKRTPSAAGYAKISATLEAPILRQIRERTTNVSGFLNEAAKRELHFARLHEWADGLRDQGVIRDERLYRGLIDWVDGTRARQRKAAARRAK